MGSILGQLSRIAFIVIVAIMLVDQSLARDFNKDRAVAPEPPESFIQIATTPAWARPTEGFPKAALYPGQDASPLQSKFRFRSIEDERGQAFADILAAPETFKRLKGKAFNLGPAIGRFLVVVSVVNKGSQPGEWVLTTNRGALRDFALDERENGNIVSRIDGRNLKKVGENLRAYHAFSHTFTLQPKQDRTFLISFEAVHSTLIPVEVKTAESLAADRFAKLAVYIGSSVGMLTIILISMVIYAQTGRPQFFWMGMAELAHVAYVLHVGGYTTFYYLYDKGPWIHIVGNILPQIFGVAMAQFARSFIDTEKQFRRLDHILLGLIIFGTSIIIIQINKNFFGDPIELKIIDILGGLSNIAIVMVLPYVAIIAARRLGAYHWPLIVAWGSLCLFVIYGTVTAFGIIPTLRYSWHITGPIGLLETGFAFWALILYLNNLNRERLDNALQLNSSLVEQKRISEEASKLMVEKEDALSTIRDQENLIHASGHDSQHVLMALQTIIKFADEQGVDKLPANLPEMLRSSAGHLEDIIGTTLANPVSGFQGADFVALSVFKADDFLNSLAMIYAPMMRKEQMNLEFESDSDLWLVSDRALLARILSNLLSNCLKYAGRSNVKVALRSDGGQIHIIVSDGGPGIPAYVEEKVRQGSSTLVSPSDTDSGTGFGLLSSKRIAMTLRGELEIAKTAQGGTKITVILPHAAKRKDSKPLTIKDAEALLPDCQLLDVDQLDEMDAEFNDKWNEMQAAGIFILPISHDGSSQMRGRMSKVAPVMLLKPLIMAITEHPLLSDVAGQSQPGGITEPATSKTEGELS